MKEHGILFKAPMVRAILAGRKTQTRRLISGSNSTVDGRRPIRDLCAALDLSRAVVTKNANPTLSVPRVDDDDRCHRVRPVFEIGDRLWVREAWRHIPACPVPMCRDITCIEYAATPTFSPEQNDRLGIESPWRPSLFMPRWASRITLEVTEVRAQRLQDISEEDAKAEGIMAQRLPDLVGNRWHWGDTSHDRCSSPRMAYSALWDHINGKSSWAANPYVWAYTFKQVPA